MLFRSSSSSGSQNGCGYNGDGSAYTLNGRDRQSVCIQGSMVGRQDANGPRGGGAAKSCHSPSTPLTGTPSHSPRTSGTKCDWRGFDGSVAGALAANYGTHQTSYICMSSGQHNATIHEDGSAPTITDLHEAPIIIDRAAFNQGENAKYPPHIEQSDTMDTLVARGPHAVCHRTERK